MNPSIRRGLEEALQLAFTQQEFRRLLSHSDSLSGFADDLPTSTTNAEFFHQAVAVIDRHSMVVPLLDAIRRERPRRVEELNAALDEAIATGTRPLLTDEGARVLTRGALTGLAVVTVLLLLLLVAGTLVRSDTLESASVDIGLTRAVQLDELGFHITAEPGGCPGNNCTLRILADARVRFPRGHKRIAKDRIKTAGAVTRIDIRPKTTILNPLEWPDNPTYAQYAVSFGDAPVRTRAHGEVILTTPVTNQEGKIGAHTPYYAQELSMVIDLRPAGLRPAGQVSAFVAASVDGVLDRTNHEVDLSTWANGQVIMAFAAGIPKDASLIVTWGG